MADQPTDTTPPAPAPTAGPTPPPADLKAMIAEAVAAAVAPLRKLADETIAGRQAAKSKAQTAEERLAEVQAALDKALAESDAKAAAKAAERDVWHGRARMLETAGAHSGADALRLFPELLAAPDDKLAEAVEAARKAKPFLFRAAEPAPETKPPAAGWHAPTTPMIAKQGGLSQKPSKFTLEQQAQMIRQGLSPEMFTTKK